MTRFNTPTDGPLLVRARRDRMLARLIAGVIVVAVILAVMVHTAWQQLSMPGKGTIDAGSDRSIAQTATEASADAQMRLDPTEILFYGSNVHG